ncbi:MoaD/ThiS family protein [Croceicoccus hydrothermalis]|uniref:MoaD/ThiS family protein n=1 Tax=Croceicoccus hydrothermalis TaxID=2867964 RepID=UPI001EFB4CF5|nr:MoaD/ThiS family protein [Croceicoccus hydrothermalis]
MLTLVFLGRLEDAAGGPERRIAAGTPLTLSDICAQLGGDLAAQIGDPTTKIALNGVIVAGDDWRAGDGDELAFLPPVSGG